MKLFFLLHSTTGNTRLVTRYAARRLEVAGHECTVHDIVREGRLGDPGDVDCLSVACPTMYFRPTFAMERAVARLPNAPGRGRPAFLLATCMGEPGAHFALLAELLGHKGWVVLGAHFVLAPSNWPSHIALLRGRVDSTTAVGRLLCRSSRPLRPLWGTIWPDCIEPDARDRADLDAFLDRMVSEAAAGRLEGAPSPKALHRPMPTCGPSGRVLPMEAMDRVVAVRVVAERCSRCGTCVMVCPAGVLTQRDGSELPRVGRGCTGCWACYNHCPDGAIAAVGAPPGVGRYRGPSQSMRELFRG